MNVKVRNSRDSQLISFPVKPVADKVVLCFLTQNVLGWGDFRKVNLMG